MHAESLLLYADYKQDMLYNIFVSFFFIFILIILLKAQASYLRINCCLIVVVFVYY